MRPWPVVCALACATTSASADEGETTFSAAVAVEASTVRHPAAEASFTLDNARFVPLGVADAGVRHGFTNWLDGGFALELAFGPNVETKGVALAGARGDVVTGLVLEARVPAAAAVRVDTGFPLSPSLTLELGPAVTIWCTSVLVDPTRHDDQGRRVRLPIAAKDELDIGAFARVRVALAFRVFDAFAVAVEPCVSAGWAGGPQVSFAIAARPILHAALGPP